MADTKQEEKTKKKDILVVIISTILKLDSEKRLVTKVTLNGNQLNKLRDKLEKLKNNLQAIFDTVNTGSPLTNEELTESVASGRQSFFESFENSTSIIRALALIKTTLARFNVMYDAQVLLNYISGLDSEISLLNSLIEQIKRLRGYSSTLCSPEFLESRRQRVEDVYIKKCELAKAQVTTDAAKDEAANNVQKQEESIIFIHPTLTVLEERVNKLEEIKRAMTQKLNKINENEIIEFDVPNEIYEKFIQTSTIDLFGDLSSAMSSEMGGGDGGWNGGF